MQKLKNEKALYKIMPEEIDPSNPFNDDKLDRTIYARNLMELIEDINYPFVICLNSQWGTGKTFFIKRFENMLVQNSFRTIYYNAWENDYSNDALISIMAEIDNSLEKWGQKNSNIESLKEVKEFVIKAAKNPIDLLLSLAIHNIPRIPEEKIKEMMTNYVSYEISKYKNVKNDMRRFTTNLEKIITNISNNKPLVFIIDELDRCRPDFAIEVLEKVKHLFSVKGIVFIICLDKEQIGCSVGSLYGEKYQKDGYLRKFFDLEINFNETDNINYLIHLFEKYDLYKYAQTKDDGEIYFRDLLILFNIFQYPQREIEQFLAKLKIIFSSQIFIVDIDFIILPILLLILEKNKSLLEEFIVGTKNYSNIINYIKMNLPYVNYEIDDLISRLTVFLIYFDPHIEYEDKEKLIASNTSEEQLSYRKNLFSKLRSRYPQPKDTFRKLIERIRLVAFFKQK